LSALHSSLVDPHWHSPKVPLAWQLRVPDSPPGQVHAVVSPLEQSIEVSSPAQPRPRKVDIARPSQITADRMRPPA
jgi:hypothetical protein